ncbi:MAG: glycolate oxidase iron-sulfur subunit [Bradyrhizobiaceae bacterium]|nr:MAG: glycolate oxidase iron-sulfur subunit [Bradyrhizobiaceae bacterium]
MQTNFTLAQLADPDIAESERILRACVHCGFCTATCPTYVLLGDELDSPRGRIYLIKDMLENDRPATPEVVRHVDRCLSCLACMTTCPSGVHYMHLVDHARARIEATYRRPLPDRFLRALLATVLPSPRLFRLSLLAGRLGRPFARLLAAAGFVRLAAMLRLVPARLPAAAGATGRRVFPAVGPRRGRVAILTGCANPVLAPDINAAAVRVLTRHGIEVVAAGEGCCGALAHHLGREHQALAQVRRNVDVWTRELAGEGLDAILITASGCGTTVKDYGFMLRTDAAYAGKAARVAALAQDISEFLAARALDLTPPAPLSVAYHAACSLQHGQKITRQPKDLLANAGFQLREVPEGHLCCGSAGTYNMLQPELADRLLARKVANIERTGAQVIATGNIGCLTQIAGATRIPIVHTVELIDWASGGPTPQALQEIAPDASGARKFATAT